MKRHAIIPALTLCCLILIPGWANDNAVGKTLFSSRKTAGVKSFIRDKFLKEKKSPNGSISVGGELAGGNIVFINLYWVTGSEPAILHKTAKGWVLSYPLGDELWGKDWTHLEDLGLGTYYAVLDHIIEGPGPELIILRSDDRGKTWRVRGMLKKNWYWSSLHEFKMAKSGLGSATLYLYEDSGLPVHKPGFYHYQTRDGGKTWTGPRYENARPRYNVQGVIVDFSPQYRTLKGFMSWLAARK